MTSSSRSNHAQAEPTEQAVARLEAVIDLLRSASARSAATPDAAGSNGADRLTESARALYRSRRRRDCYFGAFSGGFGEPMWDIMLDLFIASREGRRVSVSSASIAAEVPATTALRWLNLMEQDGMIERCDDPSDRRRTYVKLTEPVEIAMERYIMEVTGGRTG